MALVVVVTSDVADRFRGFLGSVMLEVSAGLYVAPRMNKGVRERTWSVLADWHGHEPRGSVVMVWRDLDAVLGIGISHLGAPPRELVEVDGMYVVRRMMTG
ncbi:type I-E CRISPR-associated endoribonuclease Cas2e [Caballeronia cordobensis]|uniref:type I-E CRISPR-associated endoribonuclease Cas2e n=1 Tax=Caballeronia cordobensis TaxID=1353886 RepID=UPI00045EECC0|nr:CRISPR-associated protein Cas2 [Burkholderia sp. RPE67]